VADKKRRIISAVLRLVEKGGVHSATTARIAAMARMSEPTLYRVYPNKREMLLAAADAAWQIKQDVLAPAYHPDAIEHLGRLIKIHTESIQKSPVVLAQFQFTVAPPSTGLPERVREQNIVEVHQIAEVIERGKTQGSIRPDVNSREAAWRLHAARWSEAMARLLRFEDEVLVSNVSTRTIELIIRELATEPRG